MGREARGSGRIDKQDLQGFEYNIGKLNLIRSCPNLLKCRMEELKEEKLGDGRWREAGREPSSELGQSPKENRLRTSD